MVVTDAREEEEEGRDCGESSEKGKGRGSGVKLMTQDVLVSGGR